MNYIYNILTDMLSQKLNSDRLKNEIETSPINTQLEYISTNGNLLSISFFSDLTLDQIEILNSIVQTHSGEPYLEQTIPTEVKVIEQASSAPFASKVLYTGQKLFARTHGAEYSLSLGNNSLTFEVPYFQVKINEIEISGCELGDSVDFFVLDSITGAYTTIPNLPLNQFGFDVKCPERFYSRKSNYDADLFSGMQLYMVYKSKSAKNVYINYVLHEVKL